MDMTVHTGATQASADISLISRTFTSRDRERAFLVLQVHANVRDAKALEEECSTIIHHSLLATDGEPWHRLDGTLKEFNGLFKGLLISQTIDDIHAIVGLVDKDGGLHVSHAGRGEAYLVRGGVTSQITEFTRGKPVPMFVHISSGTLEDDDTVILSTQRLLRSFTPAQLNLLASDAGHLIEEVTMRLEADREMAALAAIRIGSGRSSAASRETAADDSRRANVSSRRNRDRRRSEGGMAAALSVARMGFDRIASLVGSIGSRKQSSPGARRSGGGGGMSSFVQSVSQTVLGTWEKSTDAVQRLLSDLRHPERKRRAHMILVAGAVALFVLVWAVVQLSTNSQRSKTKAQMTELMQQIDEELKTAENRKLTGDMESANAILARAEEQAKQIINSDSGYYRSEALNALDRINAKSEEINNVTRVQPRVLANVATKNPDVTAQGLIGISDGQFVVFDKQDWYRVLLNEVNDGKRLSEQDLIVDGTEFGRYQSQVFLTSGNAVIELQDDVPVDMKTDDPNGWVTGKDAKTYLRFLYVLTGDDRIMKYERLNNRYGPGVQYNVTADLKGALDMVIDGNVFVLKQDGVIVKMLRGEARPFTVHRAPQDALKEATKLFKLPDGNFYVLDPVRKRVTVLTDGGSEGDSSYVKQYTLQGDQIGKLQDLYVDPDESHLYVMDEKRIYVVDIAR